MQIQCVTERVIFPWVGTSPWCGPWVGHHTKYIDISDQLYITLPKTDYRGGSISSINICWRKCKYRVSQNNVFKPSYITGCAIIRRKTMHCIFTHTLTTCWKNVQGHRTRHIYPHNKATLCQQGLWGDIDGKSRKGKVEFWKKSEGTRRIYFTGNVHYARKTLKFGHFLVWSDKINDSIVFLVQFRNKIGLSRRLKFWKKIKTSRNKHISPNKQQYSTWCPTHGMHHGDVPTIGISL